MFCYWSVIIIIIVILFIGYLYWIDFVEILFAVFVICFVKFLWSYGHCFGFLIVILLFVIWLVILRSS